MTSFRNNFSKVLLLANQNVTFKNESGESFELIPMKVKDVYFNENLIWFLNFLDQDVEQLAKNFPNNEVTSHYNFIMIILTIAEKRPELKETSDLILDALASIIPNIHFENKSLKIGSIFVVEEIFDQIIEIVNQILGRKAQVKINETDDEMTQKMKAMQKRIQDIKTKGKRMNENSTSFEDMFAALLYEFPQYQLHDLFELNIYTFYYLFRYVGKIANYEVSKIAAGNGLSKKHKYFIEK